jgi:phosphate/sulfate permease
LTVNRRAVTIGGVFRLMPKAEGFFDLLEQGARTAHEGAKALEHAGDKITHDTMTMPNKTFVTLIAGGDLDAKADVPLWVVLSCHVAMGLGTLAGGWRIVKTMGQRLVHLQPDHGFSAESAGALCLYGATGLGIPVSTTHTITGAMLGVGSE